MKKSLFILSLLMPLIVKSQTNRFGFPLNDHTGRVDYDSILYFDNLSKETLFKRAQEFIAAQDFDRTENIKCADNNSINTKFYERSIRYIDSSEGKILGSGFLPFKYKDYGYIYTVFEYKIQVKDGACKYEFTNFKVLEFKRAPKNKSRYAAYTYGLASGNTSFSSNMVDQSTMEEFMERLRKYYRKDGKTGQFTGSIDKMISELSNTMASNF